MTDLLFKRYASPFPFLQALMDTGRMVEGLNNTIKADNDDRMWELYLHSYPSCSFEDWKKKVLSEKPRALSEVEITTQIKTAEDILNSFHI